MLFWDWVPLLCTIFSPLNVQKFRFIATYVLLHSAACFRNTIQNIIATLIFKHCCLSWVFPRVRYELIVPLGGEKPILGEGGSLLLSEHYSSLLKKRGFTFVGEFSSRFQSPFPFLTFSPIFACLYPSAGALLAKSVCSAAEAGGYRLCFRIDTFTQKMPLMQACAGIISSYFANKGRD